MSLASPAGKWLICRATASPEHRGLPRDCCHGDHCRAEPDHHVRPLGRHDRVDHGDEPARGGDVAQSIHADHISKFLDPHTVRRRPLSRAVMGAIDLMVGHCRDPLTIEAIATRVGVAEDHLIRVFREAFGLPAATYYTRLRIAVACRLLRDTDDKMDEVRPGEFRRG